MQAQPWAYTAHFAGRLDVCWYDGGHSDYDRGPEGFPGRRSEGVRCARARYAYQDTRTRISQAHAGVGSVSFTTCTLLSAQLGVRHHRVVAYRGTGPALNDLAGGLT
jgi:hypothetical protein